MVAHCWRRKTLRTPSRRTHRTSPLPIAHSHAGRTDAPVPSPAHCGGPTTAPAAAFAFVSPWPSNILRNPIAFYGDSPRQQLTSRFKGHISPNYFHHGLLGVKRNSATEPTQPDPIMHHRDISGLFSWHDYDRMPST